jgi:alginate O-acetyltransferase complex protein AlgI
MIFTQAAFLGFFVVCFAVHWMIRNHRAQKTWLLVCSYFFYGCWDWRFLGMIFVLTSIDYAAGLLMSRQERQRPRLAILMVSLCANLGVLGFFKYFNFFVRTGTGVLHWLGVPLQPAALDVVLPVGISFITFQTLSYTIDVYRRQLAPERDFLDFALFVSFFPQLVAGPIVRARDLLPQLHAQPQFFEVAGRRWLLLFLIGFFKKACLADNIAAAIDPVFAKPAAYHAADAILSSLLYCVQIYCDFSGYSDMAIAVAGMLGYRLVQNFDFPYFAHSIQDFWRRWHMSLSSWLRDYLYVSMGGGRGSRLSVYRNLMATMILGGLWHGANLTFVLWGFLHGFALMVHRIWRGLVEKWLPARQAPVPSVWRWLTTPLSILVTFGWVALCFTIFRASSLELAQAMFEQMGHWTDKPAPRLNADYWVLLAGVAVVHGVLMRFGRQLGASLERWHDAPFYLSYGGACALLPYFMPVNTQPFIYFQF